MGDLSYSKFSQIVQEKVLSMSPFHKSTVNISVFMKSLPSDSGEYWEGESIKYQLIGNEFKSYAGDLLKPTKITVFLGKKEGCYRMNISVMGSIKSPKGKEVSARLMKLNLFEEQIDTLVDTAKMWVEDRLSCIIEASEGGYLC